MTIPQEGALGATEADVTHYEEDSDPEKLIGEEVDYDDLPSTEGAEYDYEDEGMGGT